MRAGMALSVHTSRWIPGYGSLNQLSVGSAIAASLTNATRRAATTAASLMGRPAYRTPPAPKYPSPYRPSPGLARRFRWATWLLERSSNEACDDERMARAAV